MSPTRNCPVCSTTMAPVFRHKVLGKHEVQYFLCGGCGAIATEDPYWLPEAYQSAISTLDTWGASRNLYNQRRLEPILYLLFGDGVPFVDAACGYGLLVRLMRDIGFNFCGHDEFCKNVLSTPFAAQQGTSAAAVTAFEVLEHLVNPREFVELQFSRYRTDTLIASTTTFRSDPPPKDWPYYSFESGQHVTIYQPKSLAVLAKSIGASYYPLSPDLHLISRRAFSPLKMALLRGSIGNRIYGQFVRWRRQGRSFTTQDYEAIRHQILSSGGEKCAL